VPTKAAGRLAGAANVVGRQPTVSRSSLFVQERIFLVTLTRVVVALRCENNVDKLSGTQAARGALIKDAMIL
jgi:hypothetical protein